jgi:hypothetical protein
MKEKLEMTWKKVVMISFRHTSEICLAGLQKKKREISQDTGAPTENRILSL